MGRRSETTSYLIDPMADTRWSEFVEKHPRSSVFHTMPWLRALKETYGYEPAALTTSPNGVDLRNGIVFCRVHSWLTGRRIVSAPFSDHCEPLIEDTVDRSVLFSSLACRFRHENLDYIEIRPRERMCGDIPSLIQSTCIQCNHDLDLAPDLDTVFRNFHKDCTQRKIRRAEREGLTYQEGRSRSLLDTFLSLYVLTRKQHLAPPQPRRWFENLIASFGHAIKIRVAFKADQALAAIVTLRHKKTLVYKYGCSDPALRNLGGTHGLLWRCITEAKREGLQNFDLGRSDLDNLGLLKFKDRWNAKRSVLTYSRYTRSNLSKNDYRKGVDWKSELTKRLVFHLPDKMFCSVGALLYRHIG
jgi:CelD/BcsL family acetyltransferase involved in cellulose biosynthesis